MSNTISSLAGSAGAAAAYQTQTNAVSSKNESSNASAASSINGPAAVYEKQASDASKGGIYSPQKMSKEERDAFVNKLQEEQAAQMESFNKMVIDSVLGQAKSSTIAAGSDEMWKFLASGEYTVDAETKAKAQEDISEDGYWGVKETSKRLFEFASSLAGDDEDAMKKMQDAIEKGFKEAGSIWGKDLPDISNQTLEATNKLFEDYYEGKAV